jgi:iron complex transport system substrate-binding protein
VPLHKAPVVLQAAALGVAVLAGLWLAWTPPASSVVAADDVVVVRDAVGREVQAADFQRIASLSLLADSVLAELATPERVVLTTTWLDEEHPLGFRLPGRPRVLGAQDLEATLAVRPDLVLLAGEKDSARIQRLQDAGVTVFDLGEHSGVDALWRAIDQISALLGAPERGARLTATLRARLPQPALGPTKRGLFLSAFGTSLFGGTAGTSYHDVLTLAGLRDAAAEAGHRGWPPMPVETVLHLDPDVVVMASGGRATLCGRDAFAALRACLSPGGVVELPAKVVDDPGILMIDAVEQLRAALR